MGWTGNCVQEVNTGHSERKILPLLGVGWPSRHCSSGLRRNIEHLELGLKIIDGDQVHPSLEIHSNGGTHLHVGNDIAGLKYPCQTIGLYDALSKSSWCLEVRDGFDGR
jgi:hypothetical protein